MSEFDTIRPNTLYVSFVTHKGLGYAAQATGIKRDELAETILAEWIKTNHPNIVEHMRKRYDEDREFIKALKQGRKDEDDLP